ncbi:radical SAM protein [Candidatus Uabimicrobium sp. HlEnr_7]|uniref:SPL family radical SAM protein n=1 Tax=Candidatus Uabimicrobium helgolandensis TaxID=3095367 RepID=UPI0035565573
MIDTIYIEDEIKEHPRTKSICKRFPSARIISCERYGEVFNRKVQNFRLQKLKPALILAKKFQHFALEAPEGYGIGAQKNFYFSHMLNCIYDCRYCFLQGMYRSAHYLLFVNFEDFAQSISEISQQYAQQPVHFFSGYDCDSLALDQVTKFSDYFVPLFPKEQNAWLELRTKSVNIRPLLHMADYNCIAAFSFTPQIVSDQVEAKVPSVEARISAIEKLQERGWHIGLRFDPLIYHNDYQKTYCELFQQVFSRVKNIHSVSLGQFRLPKTMFSNIHKLYPDEKLFAGPLSEKNGMVSYEKDLGKEMFDFCSAELLKYIDMKTFFPCE